MSLLLSFSLLQQQKSQQLNEQINDEVCSNGSICLKYGGKSFKDV